MEKIPCFMVEESGVAVVEVGVSWPGCAKDPYGGVLHCFSLEVFRGPFDDADRIFQAGVIDRRFDGICAQCGAVTENEVLATSASCGRLWRRADRPDDIRRRIADFEPGAMWFADWLHGDRKDEGGRQLYGPDWDNQFEPPLHVKTPGGDWNIDGRARNCTLPNERTHRCWVRHGVPPAITVDKAARTCAAGAGSIVAGNYHGFLRGGFLVRA